jgi:hypothetical protein
MSVAWHITDAHACMHRCVTIEIEYNIADLAYLDKAEARRSQIVDGAGYASGELPRSVCYTSCHY